MKIYNSKFKENVFYPGNRMGIIYYVRENMIWTFHIGPAFEFFNNITLIVMSVIVQ